MARNGREGKKGAKWGKVYFIGFRAMDAREPIAE